MYRVKVRFPSVTVDFEGLLDWFESEELGYRIISVNNYKTKGGNI